MKKVLEPRGLDLVSHVPFSHFHILCLVAAVKFSFPPNYRVQVILNFYIQLNAYLIA